MTFFDVFVVVVSFFLLCFIAYIKTLDILEEYYG